MDSFRWDKHGISAGNSPKEAAINALWNDEFFDEKTMTLWGWQIGYETDSGGVEMIQP